MANFYHIYLSPRADVSEKEITKQLNLALDWFHYDTKNWVVYTTSNQDKWNTRLKPLVDPGGYLFICRLDMTHKHGWMSKRFWEWIRKDRQPKST